MFISMHVITSTIHIRLSESLCSESLPPLLASFLSLFERRPTFPFRVFPHDLTVDFAPLGMGLLHDIAGSKHIIRFLNGEFIELLLCEGEYLSIGLRKPFLKYKLSLLIRRVYGLKVPAGQFGVTLRLDFAGYASTPRLLVLLHNAKGLDLCCSSTSRNASCRHWAVSDGRSSSPFNHSR